MGALFLTEVFCVAADEGDLAAYNVGQVGAQTCCVMFGSCLLCVD